MASPHVIRGIGLLQLCDLRIPVARTYFAAELLLEGKPRATARCVARETVARLSIERLLTLDEVFEAGGPPQDIVDVIGPAFLACA